MGVLRAQNPTKHLWIVLSDIRNHNGYGLIVNLSTDEIRTGKECPITRNEHPWLTEPTSWVCYGDARVIPPFGWTRMQSAVGSFIVLQPKCSDALVNKIIAGAKQSAVNSQGAFPSDYLKYLD